MNCAILVLTLSTGWAAAQSVALTSQAPSVTTKQMKVATPTLAKLKSELSRFEGILSTNRTQLAATLRTNTARRSESLPKPGLYKTAPYACIVLVPGPHADDQMVLGPKASDPSKPSEMPTIKPDLEFIPWSPKK